MGSDAVKPRLDPKKSYRNFQWMYSMYKKPRVTHELVALFCGATVVTVKRWYRKLNIKMYLDEDRATDKYKEWRKRVLKRDGWRCVQCGSRKNVHAHHIKQWDTHPKLRHIVSNGKALCFKCHKGIHPWMTLLYDGKAERKR